MLRINYNAELVIAFNCRPLSLNLLNLATFYSFNSNCSEQFAVHCKAYAEAVGNIYHAQICDFSGKQQRCSIGKSGFGRLPCNLNYFKFRIIYAEFICNNAIVIVCNVCLNQAWIQVVRLNLNLVSSYLRHSAEA